MNGDARGGCGCLMMLLIAALIMTIWEVPIAFMMAAIIILFVVCGFIGIFIGE